MAFVFEGRPSDSPLVESIWRTRSEDAGTFISAAATQFSMVVSKYEGKITFTVRGPETLATIADYPSDCEFLGIIFKLGTYMPPLPIKQIMDRNDVNLPEATSNSFYLHGSVWQVPDFENVDTFVERLVRQELLVNDPVVNAVLQGHEKELSPRSVQRHFLHSTGLTPKTIQQIERAHRASTLLTQGTSILDTAYEAGYYDQSHLTNSLKHYLGQTPQQILQFSQPD